MTPISRSEPTLDTAERRVDNVCLARIAQRTSNVVLITDAQARILWVNEGFTRLCGYTLDDAFGRKPGELLGSGLTDADVIARLDAGVRDGTQVSAEVLNRARDGRHFWLHIDLQPTFDAAGVLTGFMEIGTDITVLKQTERRLEQARDEAAALAAELQTMAMVARHTSNVVVVTDAERRVRWVNDGFTRVTGYRPEDAIGRSPGALLQCERTDPAEVARLRFALDAGRGFKGELLNRSKDGREYWIDIDITPLHDHPGQRGGFLSVGSDITERKAAAAALALERTWLAHIVAGTNAGEGEVNVCTGELRMSARWASMLGYGLEDIAPLARNAGASLYHPDDLVKVRAALRGYLKGDESHFEIEHRMRHRDGSWVWLQARGSVSTWRADGRPEWVSGVHIDVTERRRITEDLRESLALVDALFEAIPIPVVLKDTACRYQRMNKAYADLFQTDAASLLGKTAFELIDPASAQRHFEEDRRLLETRGTCSYEVHQELSGGHTLDALIRKSALIGAGGQVLGLVGTAVDISERIRSERAMAEATAAAEAANRAKSAFLATMSHEIRTPMNGVVGMAELLTHSPLDAEQAQTVRTIIDSAGALLVLIDDILDFSKIEAGRMTLDEADFDVTPLVEGVCATLAPLAVARRVRLTVHVDASVNERLHGDALRVRQLLNNLVGNAIKFSAGLDTRPGRVSVRVEPCGDLLRFCVTDNGIGMDPATIARLFLPFMQAEISTTRRFGGTGLGLAICRRLVQMMGGRIEVQSQPGCGAAFAFFLPLRAAAMQPAAPAPLLAGLDCRLVSGPDLPEAQLRQWLQAAGARVTNADGLAAEERPAPPRDGPVVIVHADAQATGSLPDTHHDVRQLRVQYGGRQSLRLVSPTVASIDLLRRDPFVRAVAIVAGRLAPDQAPPVVAPPAITRATMPATLDEARSQARLILVAEDDATNRAVLARQLALLGHAAEFTNDGRQALARWRAGGHALLLTDLHMPEMDGYTLAESIRHDERRRGLARLPIVAVSADALQGDSARARASGIDGYLTKPAPLLRLQAVLSTWLPAPRPVVVRPPVRAVAPATAVLNLQTLRDLTGADDTVVAELLADFWESAHRHAADLRAAWRAGDAASVAAIAHKLKSASCSVGASALAESSGLLEAAGLSGPTALAPEHRIRFDTEFAALGAAVQSHLSGTAS